MSESHSRLRPEFSHLKKEYEALVQCNRCGFCETVCPTYVVSGKETLSPRGRNQAFRQILEGDIKDPASAREIFSSCLTCHACTNVCFSQVPVGKLMAPAREVARPGRKAPAWETALFKWLLGRRTWLTLGVWPAFFLKRIGISALLKKTGLLRRISPQLDAGEDLLRSVPLSFGAGSCSGARAETAYFSGCGTHYVFPGVSRALLGLLRFLGVETSCPSHSCCGLIPASAGNMEAARFLAMKVVRGFSSQDIRTVIVDDDSCAGFMRGYAHFLDGAPGAGAVAGKVRNLSELLKEEETRFAAAWKAKPARPLTVTYHDPCQMGNCHQELHSPRHVLKGLPGVRYVELEESNWCCGGAGSYCLKHPDLSDEILERKLANIRSSGADAVITQASSCIMHIRYGMRKKGWDVSVLHMAEFLEGIRKGGLK